MTKLQGYIRLTRPANLPTAVADIIAGAAVSFALMLNTGVAARVGAGLLVPLLILSIASVLLYASGVVLNDYFDRKTDALERPERPIPSGVVPASNALVFGMVLMIAGVACSFLVSSLSGFLGVALGVSILSYDSWAKNSRVLGPLNMGLCRGVNLLLGMSVLGAIELWWMAVIPIVYIGAVTLVSRGEVKGKNRSQILLAFILYLLVLAFLTVLIRYAKIPFYNVIPFMVGFALMIFIPLLKAYKNNTPDNIRKAVKAGVISLILLDACIAVIFAGWQAGLSIVILLPLSIFLSKQFAVT